MKSILISIKPEWVALILNGDKTIEIRKTMPKCELPIKCYIYCAKSGTPIHPDINGKVVAEFVLNKITKHEKNYIDVEDRLCYDFLYEDVKKAGFVTSVMDEWEKLDGLRGFDNFVENYGNGKPLYCWYIDNLKIYDKPKELEEFYKQGTYSYSDWLYGYYNGHRGARCNYNSYLNVCRIKKPPQSWCYVEEV